MGLVQPSLLTGDQTKSDGNTVAKSTSGAVVPKSTHRQDQSFSLPDTLPTRVRHASDTGRHVRHQCRKSFQRSQILL